MKRTRLLNYRIRMVFYPVLFISNKINWRFGRPFRCEGMDVETIRHLLQPGMIILSHKEFEFTNLFIRGYWKHSAIIMDHDMLIEATGKGVALKRIDEFIMEVDDYVILRPTFCDSELMEETCRYVRRVIGYPYNYAFLHGIRAFYCSELIYWAYRLACHHLPQRQEMERRVRGRILNPQDIFESKDIWQTVFYVNAASQQ
ncbi:MAG: YiiX/YebB-like N1pC/P60 family cysteine hydrolase [Bacteroidales bacterium]|nr:hypothetical protein [Lentimicrobiaceae bacterium]MDD5695700.1 YiiX/YebB-like N1pC/P60 family cysteine hydrolase [Bacteroidales bacterium]